MSATMPWPNTLERGRVRDWSQRWPVLLKKLESRPSQRTAVEVRVGSPWMLDKGKFRAALPRVRQEKEGNDTILKLYVPGARRDNTEVVWSPDEQRLVVGVWAGKVPDQNRPRAFQPELAWYRSTYLPDAEGERASARVQRGVVEVRVPARRV